MKKNSTYGLMENICLLKLLKMMRFTIFILLLSLSQAFAVNTYSQETKLSLDMKNARVEDVIDQIEKNSEFFFMYNKNMIDVDRKVDVKVDEKMVTEVLNTIFANTDIVYSIKDRQIMLINSRFQGESVEMASQQQKSVTGRVSEKSGVPIPGATVILKGSTTGTATDIDGKFSILIPSDAILQFSFVGMKTLEVKVGSQSALNITLEQEIVYLDEVVAVGYGVQKRVNLTGAIETISSKQLANRPATTMSKLLQGQAPSIIFTPAGNAPGKNPTMEIRGNAALSGSTPPLIVINGIPSTVEDFNALNPNDVDDISVLKDAAATAIYGARAPYGVILVNTKRGSLNEKPTLTFSSNMVISELTRMPKSLNSYQFGVLANQAYINGRSTPQFSDAMLFIMKDNIDNPGKYSYSDLTGERLDGYWDSPNSLGNYDYMKTAFGTAVHQVYNLSMRGGNSKTNYYFSTGYLGQHGNTIQLRNDDKYTRLNLNGAINTVINDWLKASYLTRFSRTLTKEPSFGGAGLGTVYQFGIGNTPNTNIWNPDGGNNRGNRFDDGGYIQYRTSRYDNTVTLDGNLAKGWTAHVDGTMRQLISDFQNQQLAAIEVEPQGNLYGASVKNLLARKQETVDYYWTVQGYSQYLHKLGQHTLSLQLGSQVEEDNYQNLYAQGLNSMAPSTESIQVTQGVRTVNDNATTWATAGLFGRFNYNYKEKYLLEINGRYDGSGRFSQGKRWGFFPSASAGWVISKESFWNGIKSVVDFAKLRGSYGTVGNQGNAAGYLHIQTMAVGSQSNWPIGDVRGPYVGVPGLVNTDRTWEKYTTMNLGLDAGLFKNRFSLSYDYFNRLIWDLLGPPIPIPNVLGASPAQANNASMMTKGWEAVANWRDRINSKWDYSIGFTMGDEMSHIVDYNSAGVRGMGSVSWYPGKEVGEFWGYKANRLLNKDDFLADGVTLKIDQSKVSSYKYTLGDMKYEDLDGDGKVTPGSSTVDAPGDLVKLGNTTPRYRYSINLGSGYTFNNGGRLDLSVLLQGVGKWTRFVGNNYFFWGVGNQGVAIPPPYNDKMSLDFYRDATSTPILTQLYGENTNSFFPKPYMSAEGAKNFNSASRYFVDTRYIRLKNLQLTYTLPNAWLPKSVINGCQIYFSGENLLVYCPKLPKYIDPEMPGLNREYPQQSMYTFGLNINF
jgi:TonB-linked SusC/RagA family outer membrane protein